MLSVLCNSTLFAVSGLEMLGLEVCVSPKHMKKHADQLQATIKPVETLSSPLAHRIAHGSQGQGGSIVLAEGAEAAGEIRALSLSLCLATGLRVNLRAPDII